MIVGYLCWSTLGHVANRVVGFGNATRLLFLHWNATGFIWLLHRRLLWGSCDWQVKSRPLPIRWSTCVSSSGAFSGRSGWWTARFSKEYTPMLKTEGFNFEGKSFYKTWHSFLQTDEMSCFLPEQWSFMHPWLTQVSIKWYFCLKSARTSAIYLTSLLLIWVPTWWSARYSWVLASASCGLASKIFQRILHGWSCSGSIASSQPCVMDS